MNENGENERKGSLPEQEPGLNDRTREPTSYSQPISSSLQGDAPSSPEFDSARFMAGLIELYKKVLSEPSPEPMLKLLDQIRKNEAGL